MSDIYSLGQRIMDGTLTLAKIRASQDDFVVPYGTRRRWCAPVDDLGTPEWLHERDVKRRVHLPTSGGVVGGGTMVGALAEKRRPPPLR